MSGRDRRPVPRTPREPAAPDPVRLGIDVLILLVGLGIVVVRGIANHGGPVYIGSGAVFVAFALWRLKQYGDSMRGSP